MKLIRNLCHASEQQEHSILQLQIKPTYVLAAPGLNCGFLFSSNSALKRQIGPIDPIYITMFLLP